MLDRRRALALLTGIAMWLAAPSFCRSDSSTAKDPEIDLGIFPSSIRLENAPGDTIFQVLLRNKSDHTLDDVGFSISSDLPVTLIDSRTSRLSPHACLLQTLRLVSQRAPLHAGSIQVLVRYTWTLGEKKRNNIVTQSIPVTFREHLDLTKAVSVEIHSSEDLIYEQQPGLLYMTIRNLADRPITVDKISAWGPGSVDHQSVSHFIEYSIPGRTPICQTKVSLSVGFAINEKLSPQQALSLPIYLTVPGRLQPGSQKLLFEAELAWEADGHIEKGTLIASHEVHTGVLGESDVFKYIGVPSLLFLPGFLMVLTWSLLWKCGIRFDKSIPEFGLKPTDAGFWLIAITLSGATAWLCTWFGLHNYLTSHDYRDLSMLYAGSVLFALGSYLVGFGLQRTARLIMKGRQISPRDVPLDVLRKLDNQGIGLRCDAVDVDLRGKAYHGFLLENVDGELTSDANYVVAPQIRIRFTPSAEHEDEINNWKQQIDEQLSAISGKGEAIRTALEAAGRFAHIEWKYQEEWLDRPYRVLGAKIRFRKGDNQLVEVAS
jgi:hypothetical protein